MTDDLTAALARAGAEAEARIAAALAEAGGPVAEAMLYAVSGGKALRAFLVREGAALHEVEAGRAADAAAAIECIHAYSLVHDDLPCMDDDDLRRGRPTIHVKWDEATAVLAGDGLHSLGFLLAARAGLAESLAEAAGIAGMVGGQAADIAAESAAVPLTLDDIIALQKAKTGALIRWSAMAGPRMAGADPGPLETYGDRLGLAFQIADDLLDVEGDAAQVGKAVGKDAGAGKATFVELLGLDGAKSRARDLVAEACDALSGYGDRAALLRAAAEFVIARRK